MQKSPPRRRKDENVPLPPKTTPAFDDGFNAIAQGRASVIESIKKCNWLGDLNLTVDDGQNLVRRQFQHGSTQILKKN